MKGLRGQPTDLLTRRDPHTFNAPIQFTGATGEKPDWICFNPAISSISDSVPLAQAYQFRCDHGPGRCHGRRSVAFCNRGELWFVVHDMCLLP
jgi:hypothetical protein